MACYHLTVSAIGRSAGRSATAAAAYRSGERLFDQRTGEVHDYTRKGGILHTRIVVPTDAPVWARERERLWNEAEMAERRRNSTVAREFEVSLPAELTAAQRQRLAETLATEICGRHRCAVDVALHRPGRAGDCRNYHAHLLCSTRRLGPLGFDEKTRELDVRTSGEIGYWRMRWAELQNEHLREAGVEVQVDHRSLPAQGIVREPTHHRGPAIDSILARGEASYVAMRWQEAARQAPGQLQRARSAPERLVPSGDESHGALEPRRDGPGKPWESVAPPRQEGHVYDSEAIALAAAIRWLEYKRQKALGIAPITEDRALAGKHLDQDYSL